MNQEGLLKPPLGSCEIEARENPYLCPWCNHTFEFYSWYDLVIMSCPNCGYHIKATNA